MVDQPTRILTFQNRQRTCALDLRLLRRIARHLIECELKLVNYEIGFHLVDATEMAGINERFLQHHGSTDVITFDHGSSPERLHGEVFVSLPDAVKQAREFGTTWQSELVRYLVHALLHLSGHDDRQANRRRVMKREENRLLRRARSRFELGELGKTRAIARKTQNYR